MEEGAAPGPCSAFEQGRCMKYANEASIRPGLAELVPLQGLPCLVRALLEQNSTDASIS